MDKKDIKDFYTGDKIKKLKCDSEIKKRMELIYWLTCPIVSVCEDIGQDVLDIHNKFNEQMLKSLSKVRNWIDYEVFLKEQNIRAEQSAIKVAEILHPQKRREQGKETVNELSLMNYCNLLGEPLIDLFRMESIFVNLHNKNLTDPYDMSVGDHSNYKQSKDYFESFYKGCQWAIEDNNKVADSLNYEKQQDFKDFINENGFTYLRYPNIHLKQKDKFLSYLQECSQIISNTYGISQDNVGFKQNGLELFTTKSSEAYYVPSLNTINLRMDMINAYFHEHFHSLDHQIFHNIDLEEVKNMFGRRGQLKFSLASEVNMIDPEKITDGPSKEIMIEFNKITEKLIHNLDSNNEEIPYLPENQEIRKAHILEDVEKFLNEIHSKLKISAEPFKPIIKDIMIAFKELEKPNDLMKLMEEKLFPLTIENLTEEYEEKLKEDINMLGQEKPDTPFKQAHANYYISMCGKIKTLYNKMNDKTLFFNYSFINDNSKKGGYFASKPEMLARTAETYFFNKFPHLNITPPEWWEANSYLFYPQNEEVNLVCKVFEETANVVKQNSSAFEKELGKHNKVKIYKL